MPGYTTTTEAIPETVAPTTQYMDVDDDGLLVVPKWQHSRHPGRRTMVMKDHHPAKSTITKTIKTVNGRTVEEIVTETPKPKTSKTMHIVEHPHRPVTKYS